MLHAFLQGLIIALGLIIPLGPQNVFVFNQGATQHPWLRAWPAILTASVCDTLLILVAVMGLTLIVQQLLLLKVIILALGFTFLLYMGNKIWQSSTINTQENATPLSIKQQMVFAASVSLLNPHAILDTIGVIGTSSLRFTGSAKMSFTSACILISWLWFISLAICGHFLQKLDKAGRWLFLFNKLSALIIWGVAFYLGLELLILILPR